MLKILIALSGTRWWTLAELSVETKTPAWSVRRDMQVFKEAGIPVECTPESAPRAGIAGRYRLARDWTQKFLKET